MKKYEPSKIEPKWQEVWQKIGLYKMDEKSDKPKFYNLVMFPYPSGDLHVGHWYNFSLADAFGRFKRLQGYQVFQPIGFDAFGLPAENAAIKRGLNPKDWTYNNIDNMKKQLASMGALWNWENSIITSDPEYYKWTQWLFLQLYKKELAYKKGATVNWCLSCKTVLANEQVVNNLCERCDTEVEQKFLEQWFFGITKYGDRLLDDLEKINWPEKIKSMQRNWIGKSEGMEINFKGHIQKEKNGKITAADFDIPVFTTRTDTLFGVTYIVLAPEHPLVEKITAPEFKKIVKAYQKNSAKENLLDRTFEGREKTGVPLGTAAINPATGQKIPIWIADYVLMNYGTGAVMAVPAHDERDYEFASKFGLDIIEVIQPEFEKDRIKATYKAYIGEGTLINSGEYCGYTSTQARAIIMDWLEEGGFGKKTINYKLRDWLISRQRYWGAPIPIIYCVNCGTVPVPEEDLPVKLPENIKLKSSSKSPLKDAKDWLNVNCPKCEGKAKRETDTMDTFVCSSWYYARYIDSKNDINIWDKNKVNRLLPVDLYIGGAEHAVMHLLYVRFFAKFMFDLGLISMDEPLPNYFSQGIILGPNGVKMSKSKGNVIDPDKEVAKVGADTVRAYLGFMGPYDQGGPWNPGSVIGVNRFLNRLWNFAVETIEAKEEKEENRKIEEGNFDIIKKTHQTLKKINNYYPTFRFNLIIASLMELLNFFEDSAKKMSMANAKNEYKEAINYYLIMIAPLAPHIAEELWQMLGNKESIFCQKWPEVNPELIKEETYTLVIQINGKLRSEIDVPVDITEDEAYREAIESEKIKKWTKGKEIAKHIFVQGRLLNIVVRDK